jgi:magnesium transporter
MLPPRIVCVVARGEHLESFPVEKLRDVLADPQARVWIDLENTGYEGFRALEPTLRFHPLAVEDCVMDINRPKVDDYRDHLYLAVHSARWDKTDDQPLLRELDMLIGERYLVTYHEEPTRGVTKAREVLERRPELLARGPDELLNFILDVMVDNYFPIIETLQGELDDLEERLFRTATQRLLAEILRLKRGMSALRRIVGPQRDTILSLTREEFTGIRPETRPYLRDVYDRMTRISDLLDSYRDELAGLLEIYATQVSNRLNEVIKVLTIITVIIMPVTLIASIYGMNFRMPEQQLPGYWGYGLALSLMVVVGLGTYWWLKKSKWM